LERNKKGEELPESPQQGDRTHLGERGEHNLEGTEKRGGEKPQRGGAFPGGKGTGEWIHIRRWGAKRKSKKRDLQGRRKKYNRGKKKVKEKKGTGEKTGGGQGCQAKKRGTRGRRQTKIRLKGED